MRVRASLLLAFVLVVSAVLTAAPQRRPDLQAADIDAIAELLRLEDTRTFDEATLARHLASTHPEVKRRAIIAVGRIVNPRGPALLEGLRNDPNPDVVATVVFALGQIKDPATVPWLGQMLSSSPSATVSFEAARALGKVRTPEARVLLSQYLDGAREARDRNPVIGEALLSLGRFTTAEDITPIVKWSASSDVEIRWRAAWAMFRPLCPRPPENVVRAACNPAVVPHVFKLSGDPSPEVRFWAVRGLIPASVDAAKIEGLDRATVAAKLRDLVKDPDRRVRTEALRVLTAYDDEASVMTVVSALDDPDTWMSVSAAETLGRHKDRIAQIAPKLGAAAAANRPLALRIASLAPLTQLAPPLALDAATALLKHENPSARNTAIQVLRQMGPLGQQRLEAAGVVPPARGGVPGGTVGSSLGSVPNAPDYRAIVERWIVPAYKGQANPRAVWTTAKGEIELELFAADAPLGMEEFVRLTENKAIIGTVFSRVVPNFVAQQATITGASRLRDEVNQRGLLRANLAWASSGLDTGRPGYTLGNTPQPHNEGDFTSLGRVTKGMDVVDRLELADTITGARIVR